jgi:hypothetical protein
MNRDRSAARRVEEVAAMHCSLYCYSNSPHLSKLFTGFELLRRAGVVTLSQECLRTGAIDMAAPQHLRDARLAHLMVRVDDTVRLYFDNHDSGEIDVDAAERADFYFKRSFSRPHIPVGLVGKVFPLGLNYELYPDYVSTLESERDYAFARCPGPSGQPAASRKSSFRPTPAIMHAAPAPDAPPRVLFMTRGWDPFDHPDRSAEKIVERIRLNETRASCVEALRREFGPDFFGGFERTEYASMNYRESLLPDDECSRKENYVRLLGSFPICVTTRALHGSIGWKMGEYIAFSKAIVAERMAHEIPGDFVEGRNFLGFDDADECVAAIRRLFADASLRSRMMHRNHQYYTSYVDPVSAIRASFDVAIPGWQAGRSLSRSSTLD